MGVITKETVFGSRDSLYLLSRNGPYSAPEETLFLQVIGNPIVTFQGKT